MTKLELMLKYVSEHNDFYKKRIKEYGIKDPLDITQWPVLTRKELQENRYNMFSDGYKSKYFNQQLRRQSSSGSSGVPIVVYWDYQNFYSSNLSLWRKRYKYYSIHAQDRFVSFNLNSFNVKADDKCFYYIVDPSNVLSINVTMIHRENNYKMMAEIINDFNPTWMYIQPFVLNKLIQVSKKYGIGIPTNLKYIESVGELLPELLRQDAIDFFNVPIANMYGSEEMNCVAFECPEHHMHINSDNVLVECMQNGSIFQNGSGEAIITNLNNYAMPLIRYNQGDQITIDYNDKLCTYSSCEPIISIVKGRSIDRILLERDYEINSYMLYEIMAEAYNHFGGGFKNYKFVFSKSSKQLQCTIEADSSINDGWKKSITQELYNIFSNKISPDIHIVFDVSFENTLEWNGGKHKILEVIE